MDNKFEATKMMIDHMVEISYVLKGIKKAYAHRLIGQAVASYKFSEVQPLLQKVVHLLDTQS